MFLLRSLPDLPAGAVLRVPTGNRQGETSALTASSPTRLNPNLVRNGDVLFASGVGWKEDGSALFYVADQATDNVQEAWMVSLAGATPGPSTRMHPMLNPGRRINRLMTQP